MLPRYGDVTSLRDGLMLPRYRDRCALMQSGQPSGKPGKVREFDIRHGKVGEIVVCLWCATAVVIVTK